MSSKNIMVVLFLSALQFTFASETKVESKISAVTVYTNAAQIERLANYSIPKGSHRVIIENISPNIDAKTIQVSCTGNAIILDAKFEVVYPSVKPVDNLHIPSAYRTQLKQVNDSIEMISFEMQRINHTIELYNSERALLLNNGMIKGEGRVNDSIQLLRSALGFYHEQMLNINDQLFKLKIEANVWTKIQNNTNKRLGFLNKKILEFAPKTASNTPIYQISVLVYSKESAVQGKLKAKYIVSGASWVPAYDLRASTNGNELQFTHKAWITQNTQVDWNDAKITLSTHNPHANHQLPTINSWFLDVFNRNNSFKDVNDKLNAPSPGISTRSAESISDFNRSGISNYVQRNDQLFSAEYKIDLPYSVASDGKQHLLLIDQTDLPGTFQYAAIPRSTNSVFAITSVTDFEKLQLIPGQLQIYFDGAFIGEQYLNPSVLNDTLQITLGADRFLNVAKKTIKVDQKEKIIGNDIEITYAFEIQLKNQKRESVTMNIKDLIPIAQNKEDYEIELIESSNGRINKKTGIIEWDVTVKSMQTKTIEFSYKIKYPKNNQVNLPPA